jgi:hypothetical protein
MPIIMVLLVAGCATPAPAPAPTADPLRLGNPKAGFTVALRSEQEPPRIGAPLRLDLQTAVDGYLNLYFIKASGATGQLLTNYPVRANEPVSFPPAGGKRLQYTPGPAPGTETFILVATRQPLNLLVRQDRPATRQPAARRPATPATARLERQQPAITAAATSQSIAARRYFSIRRRPLPGAPALARAAPDASMTDGLISSVVPCRLYLAVSPI